MIPVSDATRFIGALNRIAEGVTILASAIEETASEEFQVLTQGCPAFVRSPSPGSHHPT